MGAVLRMDVKFKYGCAVPLFGTVKKANKKRIFVLRRSSGTILSSRSRFYLTIWTSQTSFPMKTIMEAFDSCLEFLVHGSPQVGLLSIPKGGPSRNNSSLIFIPRFIWENADQ